MGRSAWKANERSWKSIGGKRNHFEQEDVSHPIFSIETKYRQLRGYPTTVRAWYAQALAAAPAGKVPVLAIHLAGEVRGNDLVVLKRSDFEDLFGRIPTV